MTTQTQTQITTRQLREILFHIKNQEMTVRELRAMLFDETNQDKPLTVGFGMFRKLETSRQNETN